VLADGLLDEVFTNLITNSAKYTQGHVVPIEIRIDEVSAHSKNKGYLKVSVSDHGRGIPDSMKRRAFKRYQDSKNGSGLGLSIVHALVVERYHGRIRTVDRVTNDYTQGVTVEIWLPKV